MRCRLATESLGSALAALRGPVQKRATMPVLQNVLLRLDGDTLAFTTTDLEVEMRAARTVAEPAPGETTVSMERLAALVKALPADGELALRQEDDRLTLSAGRSRFRLATIPAEQFPAFTASAWEGSMPLDAAKFSTALGRVAHAMAASDVRYYLNGLFLMIGEGVVRLVASDGHRLALASFDQPGAEEARAWIVPRKGVLELQKWLGGTASLDLTWAANAVRFEAAAGSLAAKLVEGRYPDYQRVMPRQFAALATLPRVETLAALRRAAVLSGDSRAVGLGIGADGLTVRARNDADDQAEDFVSGSLEGEPHELGVNVDYLADALAHLDADLVQVSIATGGGSLLLRDPGDESVVQVVMPMRL